MAGETTYANMESNGGRVAEILNQDIRALLHDPTDLRALMDFIPFVGMGSDTLHTPQYDPDQAMAAASSETSGGASNTALTTSKFVLAPSRYYLKNQRTDLFDLTGGNVNRELIVQVLIGALGQTMTDLLCAAFPNLSNSVGTTTVDLTLDDIFDAQFTLNLARVPGGSIACVLHPQQYNDFQRDLRGEAGALQFHEASAEQLMAKGPGFKGMWNGIQFYDSDSVNTANASADRAGAMFGMGCYAYTLAPVQMLEGNIPNGQAQFFGDGLLMVETGRDPDNGMTTEYVVCYPSVVEAEDARGVKIVTDA